MKVLMIGSDRSIFKENSEARQRMIEYGTLADKLHIIVFSTRLTTYDLRLTTQKISNNVWVYPTNSRNKWFYVLDAYKIAACIIGRQSSVVSRWLVTCQDPFECGLAGWLIARRCKVPLQLQAHTDFLSPYFAEESLLNKIRVRIAKFLFPRAARIRVVSQRIKASLLNSQFVIRDSRIDVLPIFVDVTKIKNVPIKTDLRKKYPQFDFIALMASRFTREKNIPLAIAAFAEVVKKHPRAGLIIVGDGPEKANYKLGKNVIIEGWSDDLASYYKTADVFLLTSNHEGYGRTAVEALAAGIPVIMTDVGLAGELVKDGKNGYVIPVGDVHACAAAVEKVIQRTFPPVSIPTEMKETYLRRYKELWNRSVL